VGIEAPRTVSVNRAELLEELAATNAQSAASDDAAAHSLSEALRNRS